MGIKENIDPKEVGKDWWIIWSHEHNAFWKPGHRGYTSFVDEAGRYEFLEAFGIVSRANYPSDESGYPTSKNKYAVNEVMCPSPEMIHHLKEGFESAP